MLDQTFSPAGRRRGIVAVRAEGTNIDKVLADLNQGFAAFQQRHGSRLDQLEQAVNTRLANADARLVGSGTGMHPAAGLRLPGSGVQPLVGETRDQFMAELRGLPQASMTTQSDPDGGWTVRPVIDGTIDVLMRDISPMRGLARVVVLSSGGAWQKLVTRRGTQSGWVGEEEERPVTEGPQHALITITPGEVYAQPELTNVLLDDTGFDLTSFLNEDVAAEFALQEGVAFVTGNGVNKPRGFLTYDKATTSDATRTFGTLQYVPSGGASGFASSNPADALYDLLASLRPIYRVGSGVAWSMNSTTANLVRKFKDGQGNYLWSESLAAGQPDRLLGYPVSIDETMPDVAANAFPIAFGNWQRGYAIVDRVGMRLIADNLTKKGWTRMYFTKRTGGGLVDSNAIKLLKIATS